MEKSFVVESIFIQKMALQFVGHYSTTGLRDDLHFIGNSGFIFPFLKL